MPIVSKTVEVAAPAESIMAIVADFESYPLWNEEIKGCWVLARYDDGRPSQLRLDVLVQGQAGTFITAVYYPGPNQIYTVLQQGDHFEKQEQKFSVVAVGPTSLLTVDLEVETKMSIPKPMVKKAIGDTLEYLADNLKARAEQLAASRNGQAPSDVTRRIRRDPRATTVQFRRVAPARDGGSDTPWRAASTTGPYQAAPEPTNSAAPDLPSAGHRTRTSTAVPGCRNLASQRIDQLATVAGPCWNK